MVFRLLESYLSKIASTRRVRRACRLIRKEFDGNFYISAYPDVRNSGNDPIEHYCRHGWRIGLNPHAGFDTLYYRGSNPDVELAQENPFAHFIRHGREEGRAPRAIDERDREFALDYLVIAPEFDSQYYLLHNPDVAKAHMDPVKHFIDTGWTETRNPRADFNTRYYYFTNKDVIPFGVNPFRHYIETGRDEGRAAYNQSGGEPHLRLSYNPGLTTSSGAVPSLRPFDENDYCMEVPFEVQLATPSVRRVAAIIHVYYTELLSTILKHLDNIAVQTDLFISTDTEAKKTVVLDVLKAYSNGTIEVRIFENRGRDVAPFIVGFSDVLKAYDYFIHLQTKRSPHGGDPYEQWFKYLLTNLLGSPQIVNSIFNLFAEYNVGIVYPQHFFVLRPILNWGYDFELAASLLRRAGFVLDKLCLLEFPSGSMFWGRSAALRPLLDLDLQFSDFPDEAGQIDGTLAHAIERTFCFFAELAGFRWTKILSDSINYPIKNTVLKNKSANDISRNLAMTYRPLVLKQLSGNTATEKAIPETSSIIYSASMNQRPRLNLLVPTINPSQAFGGISTALNLFRDLENRYNSAADFRIIITEAPTRPEALIQFQNYKYSNLSVHDAGYPREIIDALERNCEPLPLRSSDIFIATAWWTAHLAFEAIDAQKTLFRKADKLVYLIQDFEPNFYGWSTKWALAENTLKRGNETIAIINSSELCSFLLKDYVFDHVYWLPYKRNEKINFIKNVDRQKLILFYGRPFATRNLFELAVDGISLWQQRNPTLAREWQIISVGETYSRDAVSHVSNFKILGKLSLEDYSWHLSAASVGLSFMLSPHSSYPPLEMAEAGIVTITNSCFGKNLGRMADNIIALDMVTDDSIAEAISNAVMRASARLDVIASLDNDRRPLFDPTPLDLKVPYVRRKKGFLNGLLNRSQQTRQCPVSIYSAKELGRLLNLEP